jgi:hypothetical protein
MNELSESIRKNLQGAVDFHLHFHEGEGYRSNLMEMAEHATSAGMSAIVIKNLFGTSQEACHIANPLPVVNPWPNDGGPEPLRS